MPMSRAVELVPPPYEMRFKRITSLITTCRTEQLPSVEERFDAEIVSLISAFVEAHLAMWIADELIFARFQLQGVHVELDVDVASVEEEDMRWDEFSPCLN